MSYSVCIKCKQMVTAYEKYCDDCVKKYNLKQDETWDKRFHENINVEEEIKKDKLK